MAHRLPDIRKLAKRLTLLQWLILAILVLQLASLLPWLRATPYAMEIRAVLTVLCSIAALVAVILVMSAGGDNIVMIVLCAILALAPCVNIFLLLAVSSSAQTTLKRAGLRVRLMGVRADEVERLLNPNLCGSCGYNLTGNTTGICPECGQPVARFCAYCGNSVLGTETGACPTCNQPIAPQMGVVG